MTKIVTILAFMVYGCCGHPVDKIDKLNKFTASAKKPIVVRQNKMNGFTYERDYTLIDSAGQVFVTGMIDLNLPDTIK